MEVLFILTLSWLTRVSGDSSYIINGNEVTEEGKWPWQGSLRAWGGHSCGVCLISDTWAITAAHCVEYDTSGYSFQFGSNNRFEGGIVVNATKIIMHEDFGSGDGAFPNDIAVVEFSESVTGTNIKPVPLAPAGSNHSTNNDCWITGWGYTEPGTRLPEMLQEAQISVITNVKCKDSWGKYINDGHVCVSGFSSNSCEGDSGGPLVCKVDGRYELVGESSWGPADCSPTYPAAYARIAYYRNWITSKTGI